MCQTLISRGTITSQLVLLRETITSRLVLLRETITSQLVLPRAIPPSTSMSRERPGSYKYLFAPLAHGVENE